MATAKHQMAQIARLTSRFPTPNYGTPEERLKGFVEASRDYSDEVIEIAVGNFIAGRVASHNAAYMPTSAQLGTECLRIANDKARHDDLMRRYEYKGLPEPEREPVTPESRARVMAMVEAFERGPGRHDPISNQRATSGRSPEELSKLAHERFAPAMDPGATYKRLMAR